MERRLVPLLLAVALAGGCSGTPEATPTTSVPEAAVHADALQTTVDEWLAGTPVPGVSVAVLLPDGSTWVGSAGFADLGAGITVTPADTFHIGSITKTFTAVVTLQLVADGVIALEDHPITVDDRIDPRITWADLLSHRSGIPEYGADGGVHVPLEAGGPTLAELVDAMLERRLAFEPGTRFHYSNTNYALLGELLESVTDEPYHTLVRSRVIEPLDLEGTFTAWAEPGTPSAWTDGDPSAWSADVAARAGAAGAIVSSADDLVRFLRDLFTGDLVDQDLVDLAVTDITGDPRGYGLGVEIRRIDNALAWGHTGGMEGYRSAAFWFPEDDMGIVVLLDGLDRATDPVELVALIHAVVD